MAPLMAMVKQMKPEIVTIAEYEPFSWMSVICKEIISYSKKVTSGQQEAALFSCLAERRFAKVPVVWSGSWSLEGLVSIDEKAFVR